MSCLWIYREQTEKSFHPEPEAPDYSTEFRDNFTKEFESHRPLPTRVSQSDNSLSATVDMNIAHWRSRK